MNAHVAPAGARHRDDARPATGAAPATARARAVISAVSLLALLVGLLAVAVDADALRWPSLLVFSVLGIGSAPLVFNERLDLPARLSLTGLLSVAVWTLPTSAMAMTGAWHPALLFGAVAVVTAPLHVAGLLRALRSRVPGSAGVWSAGLTRARALTFGLAGAGGLACLVSALTHRHMDPGWWGFATQIGPAWYVGLAMLLVAFVLARRDDEPVLATTVVLLMLVLTLTPSLVYDGPRSQSTYKHVELLSGIRVSGQITSSVEVYPAWPGFFASTAWLCDVLGIRDPMQLAVFWPPLIGLWRVVALRHLAGQLLRSPFQRWVAVALAVLADSIEADYFSPQSVGFVLGFALIALALSTDLGAWRPVVLLVAGCTLTITHQLSPFVVGGVLVILVVFRQVRPWWTPLLVLGPAGVWIWVNRDSLRAFLSPEAMGRLSNFRPPQTVSTSGLDRLPVVSQTTAALVATILVVGLLAFVVFLRNLRSGRVWAMAVSPAAGLALVAVNPYGQEGIFRAVLFALPWLAMLAASLFSERERVWARGPLLATFVVLATAFLVTTTGLDAFTVERPADVAAMEAARERDPAFQLLYLGAGDLPSSVAPGAVSRSLDDIAALRPGSASFPSAAEVPEVTAGYLELGAEAEAAGHPLFALYSPVTDSFERAYGLRSPAEADAFRDALESAPYWTTVFEQDGTILFQLDPAAFAGTGQ